MTTSPDSARLPRARVLTIAGSDSGGGAGIQADLKTMLAHGVHGMSVLTAVTAQNSLGVQDWWPLQVEAVEAQLRSVVDDIGVDAVKIGMLGTGGLVEVVAELIAGLPEGTPVVVDPVCASRQGEVLLDEDAVAAIWEQLLPLATVVTPNLPEAELLSDLEPGASPLEMARALAGAGAQWVLVKGGHGEGPSHDLLLRSGEEEPTVLSAEPIDSVHTHGTGCTFAAALASRLGLGHDVPSAAAGSKEWITGAIGAGFGLGAGIGPVDHLWQLRPGLG